MCTREGATYRMVVEIQQVLKTGLLVVAVEWRLLMVAVLL